MALRRLREWRPGRRGREFGRDVAAGLDATAGRMPVHGRGFGIEPNRALPLADPGARPLCRSLGKVDG